MRLNVNNELKEYPEKILLRDIVASTKVDFHYLNGSMLCTLNGKIINPPYDFELKEMDQIMILPIVQGG
ncbi:MAG TPA: hypothetical protein DCK95_08510 [Anaerolineaceae bacterium]|nr:hypothetical protein [Anaerolineaceae bacterium]